MKQAQLSIISKPIDSLIPHPKNPNTHDEKQIKKLAHSIKTHGFSKGSVVIQKSSQRILAGHGIVEALKQLGYTDVDVIEADLADGQAEAFMVSDNHVASQSVIDNASLQQVINELSDMNIPALDFGFDSKDLEDLASTILADSGGYQADEKDDDIPEVKEAITKTGDLIFLGKNRLLCGDSTNADDVAKLMGGVKADMVFTDPPYNVGREYGDDTDDNQTPEQYKEWQLSWMKVLPIDKNGDIFCTPGLKYCILTANCLSELYSYVWIIAWRKVNSMMRSKTGFSTWEPLLWFKNGDPKGYANSRYDIIDVPMVIDKTTEGHPTPKPLNLLCELFLIKGDKLKSIYDPFGGSGTTLIASEKLNRIAYLLEIDAHYCDVIVKRYIDFVGTDKDVFVERNGQKIGYVEITTQNNKKELI